MLAKIQSATITLCQMINLQEPKTLVTESASFCPWVRESRRRWYQLVLHCQASSHEDCSLVFRFAIYLYYSIYIMICQCIKKNTFRCLLGAEGQDRTVDTALFRRVLYHWATSANLKWWVRRDSNPRHLGCKPSALTNWATHPLLLTSD